MLLTLLLPQTGLALTKLEQAAIELREAEAKQKEAERNLKNAQTKIQNIQNEKRQTTREIHTINNNIDSIEEEINLLEEEINLLEEEMYILNEQIEYTDNLLIRLEGESKQTEVELNQTKQLLQEAIDRVEARNFLLRERLKFMYTNGTVSYLEVLLGSTNFTDFLVRFDQLTSLVNNDKAILEMNKQDYALITDKLVKVTDQLAQLVDLYTEQSEVKSEQLAARERQAEAKEEQLAAKTQQISAINRLVAIKDNKNVYIATLSQEEETLAEYSEEQERLMIEAAALVAASKKAFAFYQGGKLAYPLITVARVSSNFGRRTDPITGRQGAMHNGIDFAAPAGTDILAAESGIVITAGWVGGYGNTVILDHGNDLWTLYAHARNGGIQVKVGDLVERGQKISEVGTTGNSTGNHLHFEVRLNQKAVDPRDYLGL